MGNVFMTALFLMQIFAAAAWLHQKEYAKAWIWFMYSLSIFGFMDWS